jgi:transposase
MTLEAKSEGRFGTQDFRYVTEEDIYICPAGERLTYRYTNEENGLVLRRYWTSACGACAIERQRTPSVQCRVTRWEHEHLLEAVAAQRSVERHAGTEGWRRREKNFNRECVR